MLVLGGGGGGKGAVRTRAEEMELRKRVGVMFGKNRRAVKSAGGEEKPKGLEKKEVSLSFHHNVLPFFVFLSLSLPLFSSFRELDLTRPPILPPSVQSLLTCLLYSSSSSPLT